MSGFLRSTWYVAALPEEIGRTPVRRRFLGEPVLLFRREDGAAVALVDRCPHRFAPLSMGRLQGDEIECPYHGLRFDSGGRCTFNPHGDGAIPALARVGGYPLEERHGLVWIWMGSPREADPAEIPDFSIFTRLRSFGGYVHLNANYQLLTDNVLDGGSHVDFVHRSLRPEGDYLRKSDFTQSGNTVRGRAWWWGSRLNAFMKGMWPDLETVNIFNFTRWDAPALVLLEAGVTVAGETDTIGPVIPAAHLATPEAETTTHYFWLVGRDFALDDPALDDHFRRSGSQAFELEDRPIIEAQQANMGAGDFFSLNPVLLPCDGAAMRARRILAARIAAEREIVAAS